MARFTHPAIFDGGMGSLVVPHAQFISLQTQQAPVENVAQAVVFETTVYSQGVSIQQDNGGYYSKIVFEQAGVYNIAFSGQLHNTGGGGAGQDIFMWFRKNGVDIPDSNTKVTVSTNSPYVVAAWNIFVDVDAGDNVQLVGYPNNHHIVLQYIAATASSPATPSMILTVNQVA